ncbi:MAG: 16S rRNA (guanine(966)-N(2))-methyltransferase RsmD [Candidatus Omnitrophota bacterium]
MRIIGGEYRSRLIEMPKGTEIRPTQDRVREAVFNILADVNGKRVLDLFAGSGAYGLEAVSRGASHVTFVENNSRCLATIDKNLGSLSIPESKYAVMRSSAYMVFDRLDQNGEKFDLIFIDPPYHKDMAKKCLQYLDYYDILSPIALVVVEHSRADSLEVELNGLFPDKERKYGDTIITIFKKYG